MGLNIKEFREQRKAEVGVRRGEGDKTFYSFPEGVTIGWVCPPTSEMEPLPYVRVLLHNGVGPGKGKTVVCLSDDNPVLRHPAVVKYLKARNIVIPEGCECPVCSRLNSEEPDPVFSDEKLKKMQARESWIYPWTPMFEVDDEGNRKALPESERIPACLMASYTVHEAICDTIESENRDITDPNAATLIRVKRTGTGMLTKYKAGDDKETSREPMRIPKPQRFAAAARVAPGKEADPFKVVAIFTKTPEQIEAILRGEEVSKKKAPDEDSGTPACFGHDYSAEDSECAACPHAKGCAKECGEDFTEAKAPAKVAPKVAPKEAPKEAPKPAPAKVALPKKAPEPEPEPEEEAGDEPECFGQFDADEDACAQCDLCERCGGATKPRPTTRKAAVKKVPAPEPEEDDVPFESKSEEGSDDAVDAFERELKARKTTRK